MCPSQFQSKYVCFSGFTVQIFAMQSQYFIPRLCKQMSDGLLDELGRHVWLSKMIEGEIHSKTKNDLCVNIGTYVVSFYHYLNSRSEVL